MTEGQPADELAERIRALEAERLRPVPPKYTSDPEAAARRMALLRAFTDDDEEGTDQ